MRAGIVLTLMTSFVLVLAVLAQSATSDQRAWGNAPIAMTEADLKWMDLDPVGAPGVKIANLWGNYQKGAFGAFDLHLVGAEKAGAPK